MEMMMLKRSSDDGISGVNKLLLPPGFLFCPSDEELVLHFLYSKANSSLLTNNIIIPDLDLFLTDPWQLNGKALSSGNQYYFYTKVNSSDEKRSTEKGYWKEIGVGESIMSGVDNNKKVGMKKYLMFHIIGEQGTDHETNWVMQEYHHLISSSSTTNSASASSHHHQSWSSRWVLCRVYEKNSSSRCQQQGVTCSAFSSDDHEDDDDDTGTELSWLDEVYLSLDDHLQEQEQEVTMHYV